MNLRVTYEIQCNTLLKYSEIESGEKMAFLKFDLYFVCFYLLFMIIF